MIFEEMQRSSYVCSASTACTGDGKVSNMRGAAKQEILDKPASDCSKRRYLLLIISQSCDESGVLGGRRIYHKRLHC
jgi:hypothetical protein